MIPEQRKGILLLFLAIMMPMAVVWLLSMLFPPPVAHEHKGTLLVLVIFVIVLTWGLAIHAIGAYQKKRWLSEAQDAKAPTVGEAPVRDAAVTPPTDGLAPQPLGFGTIVVAGAVTSVVVSAVAGAMLPHASKAFTYIVGIAAAVTVVHMLLERRKRQVLRQAGLDAPASAPQPRDEASV